MRTQSAASATGTGMRISPESSQVHDGRRSRNTRARRLNGAGGACQVRSIDFSSSSVMICTPQRLEYAAKVVACAMQARFNATDIDAACLGRFLQRHSFILD